MHPDISESPVRRAFPLFMRDELEVPVNQSPYVVGVMKSYPARLREMISAAIVTYFLQNSSIDHTRRTHLKGLSYTEDEGGETRLDRACRAACDKVFQAIDVILKSYPATLRREPSVGEWIGDLTLVRIRYSFERAFAEADKGALYESVAIGRMVLEQVCWVYAIRQLNDVDLIKRKSASRAVGEASKRFATTGRLYGWMSDHAHWAYGAHVKAITSRDGLSGAMFASCLFKCIAYAMLIALTDAYMRIFYYICLPYNSRSLNQYRKALRESMDGLKCSSFLRKTYNVSGKSSDIFTLISAVGPAPRYG